MKQDLHSIGMIDRRSMLRRSSIGFGVLAASGMMNENSARADRSPHHRPKAKSVILCYMSGGVSHVDSFDPKPRLTKEAGKPMPMKVERTQFNQNGNIFPSPFSFQQQGQSGLPVSSLFPHMASCADELAVIRSMTSKVNEHAQGNYFFHTGFPFIGHPSAGAWVNYGLGTENENLPGFVVLQSGGAGLPHGGIGNYSSGYLPARHQSSILRADADDPVRNIRPGEPGVLQRRKLDLVSRMDGGFLEKIDGHNAVETAIRNYETAWRMQAEVPELCDLSGESDATKTLYGIGHQNGVTDAYAKQALLARRLVEKGVRFVELSCLPQKLGGGQAANPWDQHSGLEGGHRDMALQVDQPIAGLIKDLKMRGLLDETLVIWAGEFGRTPFQQGSNGRDHNPYGFSVWMAGGGVKGGSVHGATDEYGYHVVDGRAEIYDLWATALHLLGMNHERLTYRYGGRDFRLTDVHGHVLHSILKG